MIKDRDKYFVKKGDESGKLYELFSGQYKYIDKSKIRTYTSVGGGFDFKHFTDDEVEPAPTHLLVAARLRGDLDNDSFNWWNPSEEDFKRQVKQFEMKQLFEKLKFEMDINNFDHNFRKDLMEWVQKSTPPQAKTGK